MKHRETRPSSNICDWFVISSRNCFFHRWPGYRVDVMKIIIVIIDGVVEEVAPTQSVKGEWRKWVILRNHQIVSSIQLPTPLTPGILVLSGSHQVEIPTC